MSDFDDVDDELDDPQPQQQRPAFREADIREWRKKAKRFDEVEPELSKLQRENLLLRTPGLNDLSERQMKALFATHEGDLTPDSLRATAEDLGFVAPPAQEVPDAEIAAQQRTLAASAGSDSTQGDPLASVLAAETEDEFWAKARAAGVAH